MPVAAPVGLGLAHDVSARRHVRLWIMAGGLLQYGLARLLAGDNGVTLVGSSEGIDAGVGWRETQPDVVLVELSALAAVESVTEVEGLGCGPTDARVVAVLERVDPQRVWAAVGAGINGLVSETSGLETVRKAILAVGRGGVYLDPDVQSALVLGNIRGEQHRQARPFDRLTHREREVTDLLLEGCPSSQIARRLDVSVKTVDAHRHRALGKLGCRNMADLTRAAVREGVISIHE